MTEILLIIIFATQLIIFYKLNKRIMGAQAVTEEMIAQVIAIVTEAFNLNVGDLTEAEAQAKKEEFIAAINAIVNPA